VTSATAQEEFEWFAGIDWATTAHQVSVGEATGATLAERVVAHTGTGLTEFVDWLTRLTGGQLTRLAVAIETPRGAVVETLLARGAAVFTLNPKQSERFRDRFTVAGAKDDRLDARVLRSALRTDRDCFRRVQVDGPGIIRLRELARADEDLAEEFMRLTNRLREQVHRIAPEWLKLSTNADEPWFWAMLEYAATPEQARRMRRGTLTRILDSHRIRRLTAEDVLRVVQAPPVHVTAGTVEATATHIALLLPRVRLVHTQRQQCAKALEALLAELATTPELGPPSTPGATSTETATVDAPPPAGPSDVAIVRSVPGVGVRVATVLFAEAASLLRTRSYRALRAVAGLVPVTRRTGKQTRGRVVMRYACNGRLRQAFYHMARVSTMVDPAARAYYRTLRAKGHTHGRALRSVGERWLRILIAMLTNRTLYDPTRLSAVLVGAGDLTVAHSTVDHPSHHT
jgi:transposase